MFYHKKNKLLLILILIFLVTFMIFPATKKSDEKRFQLGFGIIASSCNLLNLIESIKKRILILFLPR